MSIRRKLRNGVCSALCSEARVDNVDIPYVDKPLTQRSTSVGCI